MTTNPPSPEQAFDGQLRRFRELFFHQCMSTPLGPRLALPSAVLSFAEALMLCPTEEAALTRMQRDREGARGAYIVAGDVGRAADIGRARILIPYRDDEAPFALLGHVVALRAQAALDQNRKDEWLPGIAV